MAKRPSNVVEALDKKFMGKSFSNTIMNTPIDTERLQNSPLAPEQVEQVKKRYNIKTFPSRDNFNYNYFDDARRTIIEDMTRANKLATERHEPLPYKFRSDNAKEEYVNRLANERLDKWYSYYEHRELLILSGQYDDLRAEQYRTKYLEHLKLGNISGEVIRNIKDMSLEEWKKLVQQPETQVDKENYRKLPFLESVYAYSSHTTSEIKSIEDEIKEAFSSADIEFKSYPEEKPRDIKRRKIAALTDAYYMGNYDLHKNSQGKWVAPYIGTEDGKDGDIVLELVDSINRNSDKYQ